MKIQPAAWAWLTLGIIIVLFVVAFDLWAHFTNHLTMSSQMRDWLYEKVAGPIAVGLLMGSFIGLMYHFWQRSNN